MREQKLYPETMKRSRAYRKVYYVQKRAKCLEFIRQAKEAPCTDCGKKYPYYVMDFDHVGEKKWTIAKRRNSSIDVLVKELSRCAVVCVNCHKVRTYVRIQDARKGLPERIVTDRSQRAYNRAQAFIRSAKSSPCVDCCQQYPYYVMEFDHVRGEKKWEIARRRTAAIETLAQEIAKCDVVCSNCHRVRSYLQTQFRVAQTGPVAHSRNAEGGPQLVRVAPRTGLEAM